MKNILILITLFFLASCRQEKPPVIPQERHSVQFSIKQPSFRLQGPPNARMTSQSEWVHILPESVTLRITNTYTNQSQSLQLNVRSPQPISLANGVYSYSGESAIDTFSDFLPLKFSGNFTVRGSNLNIEITPNITHGLITVKNQLVSEIKINDRALSLSNGFYYVYVQAGFPAILQITESIYGSTVQQPVNPLASNHFNFILELEEGESSASVMILLEPFIYEDNLIIISRNKTKEVMPGDTLELIATPNQGFAFDYWTDGDDIVAFESNLTYIMPPRDVKLTAHFKRL